MKKTIFSTTAMKFIVPIVVIAVIATGAYFVTEYANRNNEVVSETSKEFSFEEDQERESNEAGSSGGIEIPGYSTISIPSGETAVSVNFYNPENNSVYFEISLMIVDTEEVVYQSNLLSPGQHLYEIELERTFEAGEYDMVILYNTYSMDEEYTPKNGATVNCVLAVK